MLGTAAIALLLVVIPVPAKAFDGNATRTAGRAGAADHVLLRDTLELTSRGAFRSADWSTPSGLELVRRAGIQCIDDLAALTIGLTNGDVFVDPAAAADEMTRWYAARR